MGTDVTGGLAPRLELAVVPENVGGHRRAFLRGCEKFERRSESVAGCSSFTRWSVTSRDARIPPKKMCIATFSLVMETRSTAT